jgi:hypothetical protein
MCLVAQATGGTDGRQVLDSQEIQRDKRPEGRGDEGSKHSVNTTRIIVDVFIILSPPHSDWHG